MPRANDGAYSLPAGTIVNSGDTIQPSQHNPAMQDIAQALSNSVDRDGRGGMRAPLDMGGNPIRNIRAGSLPTDVATVGQAMPVGAVIDYAGSSAPEGWLMCYGQSLAKSLYPDLFAVIGSTYGSTTDDFNLPDLRGRVVAAADNMGGTAASRLSLVLGQGGGEQAHVLTTAELAAHSHTGSTNVDGAHNHDMQGYTGARNNGGGQAGVTDVGTATLSQTATDGAHSHAFTTDQAGSGSAHNNVQPTFVLNKIIKAKF